MYNTGTYSKLSNEREYTEDEKTVLLYFFTNIDKNVYCAKDTLSSQLWAFLMGQYSRSHLSLRDRFLKMFEDAKEAQKKGIIKESDYISLEALAKEIRENKSNKLEYFTKKASEFLKKWGVDYGHNSLKDADKIRYAIEGISQVLTKLIEAPFPTLGDFQEKSTRYIPFGKENLIIPPKLEKSKYGVRVKKLYEQLIDTYEKYLPELLNVFEKNNIIKKEEFKHESAYKRTLKAKAFDSLRYLLPSGIATSLGLTYSARTAESHISEMLSHPLEEARLVGKSMHEEGLKVSPGLLSRVSENEYLKTKRIESLNLTKKIFKNKDYKEIIRFPQKRVTLISTDDIDTTIATSILFESSKIKGISFEECKNTVLSLSQKEKEEIIETELGKRGQFDRMPRSLQHGTILFEFLVDFGAYRDIQRHRASQQIWQGSTAIHGYDYPEYIDIPVLKKFKEEYDKLMTEMTVLSREIIEEFPYESEYISALGHLIRTTFEMHPGQLAYVTELRTTPQGHQSYRRLFHEVQNIVEEKSPIFSKYIRVTGNLESTRKKQEEKLSQKRKELGLE